MSARTPSSHSPAQQAGPVILALDQGTTSTRAFLARPGGGGMVELLRRQHRQILPRPGWVEHDPLEILADLRACLAAGPEGAVVALGNQGESCLAWEAGSCRPLSPLIVWQDDRSRAACAQLKAAGHEPLSLARAGLPLDPYFAASKLAWILQNCPEAKQARARGLLRLGTSDAFFREALTGRFATDVTTASRTGLMNITTLQWDSDLCALFDLPSCCLPPIGPSAGHGGAVDPKAVHLQAGDLGDLGRGQRLWASMVDQQAALYGHGCRQAGEAKITFGTGAFALMLTKACPQTDTGPAHGKLQRPAPGGGILPTLAWQRPGQAPVFALEGGVYTASGAVNWARDQLGLFDDYAAIDGFGPAMAIDQGLAFVPALAGLAAPHWNRQARGAWLGLGLDSDRRVMMQALLEGIAFRMAEVLEALALIQPPSGVISVDGGLMRNQSFAQILADLTGRSLALSSEPELTALGLAQMAAEAAGLAPPDPAPRQIIAPRPGADLAAPERRARFAAARAAVEGFARAAAQDV